ncbi:amino acid permease [Microlunatus endophyticus]|uniref:Amino acid permease n=1 Tax=Microlunatus endophyticus TaxID=1716077 RepID=A0A917S4Z4_9ACTN|nr:APC family permease [Microlunatus endophyticus]GGL55203.1 amino acid permease [Microlunatus endophyticus]
MTTVVDPSPQSGTSGQSGAGLRRNVGFIGLLWVSTGSIIGSGWLFGSQKALAAAGPAAIISWAIGGVAVAILALVHAELGGMYPFSGGTARFPHLAFGGIGGASFGWFSWLQSVATAPIEVTAMISYAQHYRFASGFMHADTGVLTPVGIVISVLMMGVFTGINFLSVRALARTNSALTWWKVAVPLFTILILAIFAFHGSNFASAGGRTFFNGGVKGILSAVSTSGIIFAFLGFEQADQLAGESANPKKHIPRAVIGSVIIGLIIYIALQIVFIGAIPGSKLLSSWAATSAQFVTGPFALVATLASLGWLATVLYIDAVISPGGTGLIYFTANSRVAYGMSRNGYFPAIYEKLTSRGVPWAGLLTTWVVGSIAFLPFPSWQSLVGLITSASVLMFAGAPLALGAFRKRIPHVERPYRLPAASVLSPIAFVIANFIILWTGWDTDWKLGVCVLIGFAILVLNRVLKLNSVPVNWGWRNAIWLPVYLVVLGLIVLVSDFGPFKHPWLPLGFDMLATTIFSLVIYYWAVNSAADAETIEATAALSADIAADEPEAIA